MLAGDTDTLTGVNETVADTLFVGSATLVAVTVTIWATIIGLGAV